MSVSQRIHQLLSRRRWDYLGRSVLGSLQPERRACPNCGSRSSESVASKLMVTALVRCTACRLLYRTPTDPAGFGDEFYQTDYESGWTTDLPRDEELTRYLMSGFRGTPKDFSAKIDLLRALGLMAGARLLDYGASWGYATWQFREAGFDAVGYELGRARAQYARDKLGVPVHDDIAALEGGFDAFFSSHVIEHVPSPLDVFNLARKLIRPGGLFIAFTPNGSLERMRQDPGAYHRSWGDVHPCLPDEEFYRQAFADRPKLLSTSPVALDAVQNWDRQSNLTLKLTGSELLCVVAM